MSLGMYKPGQGYWTRVLTAIASLALAAGASFWIATKFFVPEGPAHKIVWAVVMGGTAATLWVVLNRPRVVDFMIAVETEMKKVSWPSRKSLISMTIIVISGIFGLAAMVFGIDYVFVIIFKAIHIL